MPCRVLLKAAAGVWETFDAWNMTKSLFEGKSCYICCFAEHSIVRPLVVPMTCVYTCWIREHTCDSHSVISLTDNSSAVVLIVHWLDCVRVEHISGVTWGCSLAECLFSYRYAVSLIARFTIGEAQYVRNFGSCCGAKHISMVIL